MFDRIKTWWKGGMSDVAPIETISQALGVDVEINQDMVSAIGLWNDMFRDEAPWLFDADRPAKSLGLPAAICSELARLATIEMQCKVEGSPRADFLMQQLSPVLGRLRIWTEFGAAGGGLALKPYVAGGQICVDVSRAGDFCPVAFGGNGEITAAAFIETLTRGETLFRRLEYHRLEPGGCVIENLAFETDARAGMHVLGKQIDLSAVPEWAGINPRVLLPGTPRLLVGFFRMPLANHIDPRSPLGVSAFSRAADLIQDADEQWARILWEYEGAELAIHADDTLFRRDHGTMRLPQGRDRLYRTVQMDAEAGGKQIEVFSPTIRDASLFNGLNNTLRRIEFACSLAYGTLSDPQNVDMTAEEIRASKQRSYALVRDVQKALESALDDLLVAMDTWATLAKLAPPGPYKTTYHWDDSIINAPDQRKQMFWQYVQAGKYPMWMYLKEFEGMDEKAARAAADEAVTAEGEEINLF